jgi:hypothetical protein
MFDGQQYRDELIRRLDAVRRIIDASHPALPLSGAPDAGRDARGLAILLLFASYENLLTSLCRRLLEIARTLRVSNRRLRKGFRLFAVHNLFQSLSGASEGRIWRDIGPRLLDCAFDSRQCSINSDLFPADGSFMKRSQLMLFCDLFELGDPGPVLREVLSRLDTVVTERNGIAHGRLTPEEVGRNYSLAEIRALVDVWQQRWNAFIDHVESRAQHRSFYRLDR